MVSITTVICDGCGQGTTYEHIARRLARLEQTTRYRPIHIQAVFLSAQSPSNDAAFLYSGRGSFDGEAAALLDVVQIEKNGREADAVLAEFQRRGYFLTHMLECAPENGDTVDFNEPLRRKLPSIFKRLRTSLKPRKVFVISPELSAVCDDLKTAQTEAELILDGTKPFDLTDPQSVDRLRARL